MTGKVKHLKASFGFISAEEDGRTYFFHVDDEVGDVELSVGDRVEFQALEPVPAAGPRAIAVMWVSGR